MLEVSRIVRIEFSKSIIRGLPLFGYGIVKSVKPGNERSSSVNLLTREMTSNIV
jgi:hypothetical protein